MAAALVGNTLPSAALQLGKELQHPLRRARISPQASRASQAYSRGLKPTAVCGALGFLGALAPTRRRPTARRAGPTPVDKVAERTLAVVGLGNVGARFDGTRHNIGFAAVDEIASKLLSTDRWMLSSSIWQEAFGGTLLRLRRTDSKGPDSYEQILLFKPSSMMNGSGGPVSELVASLELPESSLAVIYDDLDLDVGRLRLRKSGSAGGQNGVKSILARGLQRFLRVRLGVSRPPKSGGRDAIVGHVLGKFRHEELELSKEALGRAAVAIEDLADGISWDNVMNKFNRPVTALA